MINPEKARQEIHTVSETEKRQNAVLALLKKIQQYETGESTIDEIIQNKEHDLPLLVSVNFDGYQTEELIKKVATLDGFMQIFETGAKYCSCTFYIKPDMPDDDTMTATLRSMGYQAFESIYKEFGVEVRIMFGRDKTLQLIANQLTFVGMESIWHPLVDAIDYPIQINSRDGYKYDNENKRRTDDQKGHS